MSVSVDDTGKELPATNDAETRATDAVRELKRGASCKEVLKTLWPSDAVDEASLAAFARILRNDAILARCPLQRNRQYTCWGRSSSWPCWSNIPP